MDTSNNPERSSNNHETGSLTDEDFQVLEALGRIETVEGIDYLDGVALPPDNDEPYTDETFTTVVTDLYNPDTGGRWGFQQYTQTFKNPSTNKDMREQSIRSLAAGIGMVYQPDGSNYFIGLKWPEARIPLLRRVTRKLVSLLFGKKPEQENT